jgi:hypothetical protein
MTAEVNHKELKEHIKKSYNTDIALFVKGTMGIGKSDVVKQTAMEIAKEKGLEFVKNEWGEGKFSMIDIRLSQRNPEDLKGLPMFNKDNKTTEWYVPEELPKAGQGIIFFDELNLAVPSIQAAAYEIILEKRLGTYKIPEGWGIVAAGNGTNDNANTYLLSSPLKNRFSHVQLGVPSINDWTIWAAENNINPSIISFLNFKEVYLYKFDSNSDDDAFATPRSWSFASKLIEGETKDNSIKRYLASAVGEGIAHEYIAFHKMAAALDIDGMIKSPDDFKSPKEINMKYAIAGAFADRYNKNPKLLQNICKIWIKLEPEFTVISMKMCKAYKPRTFFEQMLKLKEWEVLSREYSKYIMD